MGILVLQLPSQNFTNLCVPVRTLPNDPDGCGLDHHVFVGRQSEQHLYHIALATRRAMWQKFYG